MKLETLRLTDLVSDPNNARKHDEKNLAAIKGSLTQFGQRKPIVIQGSTVIAGNGTLEAAKQLGWDEIQVVRVPEDWTKDQAKAFALADNRTAELATWNEQVLAAQVIELKEAGIEVAAFGFEAIEPEFNNDGEVDETPEPPAEPVSKIGDIWQLGKHRVMCGDSTDLASVKKLTDGTLVDMVYTDPPYGVNYDGGHATEKRREKLKNDDAIDMYDLPIKNAFAFSKNEAPLYLWFADRFANDVIDGLVEAGYQIRNWIIWNKNVAQFGAIGAQYKSKHEPCIYAFKRGQVANWTGPNNEVTVWDVSRDHKNEHHPTQKPVELAKRAMGNHKVNAVLDLFGGSGATLIAAEQTNRTCYMMELDPKYCDVIVKRWENLTGQKAELL
jgi:site-specific DNA-methyltransferase (adenine-specific)